MVATSIRTSELKLELKTREDVQAMIGAMNSCERSQLSIGWLARFQASTAPDPWIYGFSAKHCGLDAVVGNGDFTGPPVDGVVEIAYGVVADHCGRGFATQIARALTEYAFSFDEVKRVRAHTLPDSDASQRFRTKCGFEFIGEFVDSEDGLVRRFEEAK